MDRRSPRRLRDRLTFGLCSRRRGVRRTARRGVGIRGDRCAARARRGTRHPGGRRGILRRGGRALRGRVRRIAAVDRRFELPIGRVDCATPTESRWQRHLFESVAIRNTSARIRTWQLASGCSWSCTWSRAVRSIWWTLRVAVGSSIWPHGRWEFTFGGEANHAGSTRLVDRRDPMLAFASSVHSARAEATAHHAVATFGKVIVSPNGANAIPSEIRAWLDARARRRGDADGAGGEDNCGGAAARRDSIPSTWT